MSDLPGNFAALIGDWIAMSRKIALSGPLKGKDRCRFYRAIGQLIPLVNKRFRIGSDRCLTMEASDPDGMPAPDTLWDLHTKGRIILEALARREALAEDRPPAMPTDQSHENSNGQLADGSMTDPRGSRDPSLVSSPPPGSRVRTHSIPTDRDCLDGPSWEAMCEIIEAAADLVEAVQYISADKNLWASKYGALYFAQFLTSAITLKDMF
jgi:hypothetical protein